MLQDPLLSIRVAASKTLSIIARSSPTTADAVVNGDVLPLLVYSLAEHDSNCKAASASALHAIAMHNATLAQAVVDAGTLEAVSGCLEDLNADVQQAGAQVVSAVACHSSDLAQQVVNTGLLPHLVACLQEYRVELRSAAVQALADVARHSAELAQAVIDAGAIQDVTSLLYSDSVDLQRRACVCLAHIAKHTVDLADVVVAPLDLDKIFGRLHLLSHENKELARAAAVLVRELVKHSRGLAQAVAFNGGIAALVDAAARFKSSYRLPSVMALGYISAFEEKLAGAVIDGGAVPVLVSALDEEKEDHILGAIAWALGHMGDRGADQARVIADAGALTRFVDIYQHPSISEDLMAKTKGAFKSIVGQCCALPTLDPLLSEAPVDLLKHVVARYAAVLPNDAEQRKRFVRMGGLRLIMQRALDAETAAHDTGDQELQQQSVRLNEVVQQVTSCFSEDVVRFYAPDREEQLANLVV